MPRNHLKKIVVVLVLLGAVQNIEAYELISDAKNLAGKAAFWKDKPLTKVSFKKVYPKPLYQKSYFAASVTGGAIIVAGAVTYFTAGAGAPAAATGVSSVATLVGGGGAGSYMAGLSAIGGLVGGNAMVGAAILNGISIGIVGGGYSTFASLPAIAKVGVMASVTASALDGVAVFQNPNTKYSSFTIRIAVPTDIGSADVKQLTDNLEENENEIFKNIKDGKDKEIQTLVKTQNDLNKSAIKKGKAAIKKGSSNEDLIVLAIVCKNAGQHDLFKKLVNKIQVEKLEDSSFIDYLKAVDRIESRDIETATALLRKSWNQSPYSLEQPLLLVNILGHKNFDQNEGEILEIVAKADEDFDSDKYVSGYGLSSLYYRVATMYHLNKNYQESQIYYEKAYKNLSTKQKHWGSDSVKNLTKLGIANALYGQGNETEAKELLDEILDDIEKDEEKSIIRAQYAGNV